MAMELTRHGLPRTQQKTGLTAPWTPHSKEGDLEGGENPWTREVLTRFLDLTRALLLGGEGHPEALASLVEEWARNDPRAGEGLMRVLAEGESILREEKGGDPASGMRSGVERAILETRVHALEAYLRGREHRERILTRRWKEIGAFPQTLAEAVDPLTLARAGLERLKGMLGLEGVALLELGEDGELTILAGDRVDIGGAIRLEGVVAKDFLKGAKAIPARRLVEECGWKLQDGWRHAVLLPMVVRKRVSGGLLLNPGGGDRRRGLSSLDLETAEAYAARLAEALENAWLHAREQRKIRETLALLEIARVVNSTLDLEEILDRVAAMVVEICPVTLCGAYLREDGTFRLRACRGFIEESSREMEEGRSLRLEELGTVATRSLEEGRTCYLTACKAGCLLPEEWLEEHGVEEVLLQPLSARGRTMGFLALFHTGRPNAAEAWEESQLAEAIAAQASLAVENASLYEDIERGYFSTVQALAKAIEVKDPYTRGHSEKVTTYALMIAEEMGLDERERQKLKYAATLHDIGKIGIAGRVLNKPGALTEEEYTHVKTHPLLGDSIVEPVEFLQEPRPIILHHHERYDGKGYPDGLKGEDIPLCARILSVADAFEAMRSDRPYRKALPLEEARQELVRNAGTQFDPEVVEVFLRILDRHGGDPVKRGGEAEGAGESREGGGMGTRRGSADGYAGAGR